MGQIKRNALKQKSLNLNFLYFAKKNFKNFMHLMLNTGA